MALPRPNLIAFESRLATTCSSRGRSQSPSSLDSQVMASDERDLASSPASFAAAARTTSAKSTSWKSEIEMSALDPSEIDELVDEPAQAAVVAFDRVERLLQIGRRERSPPQSLHRQVKRRQRAADLVGHDRKKLRPRLQRVFRVAKEACVDDAQGHALPEPLADLDLAGGVATWRRSREDHRAERPSVCAQGHGHARDPRAHECGDVTREHRLRQVDRGLALGVARRSR